VPNPSDKYEKSLPEIGTAARTIRIQESGNGPYEILLELNTAFGFEDPSPVKGWFEIQNREITIENLYAGEYTVSLRDQVTPEGDFGCLRTYQMIIPVDESIWIPNVITPNNDGKNDTFFIRNLPPSGSKLVINDRWGKQVYSSANYQSYYVANGVENIPVGDWGGEGAEPGVYYYRLQIEGGKVFTGWVEVQPGN
jgi:gliding motility-associated-like protein